MLEVVIDSRQIQSVPGLMPRNVQARDLTLQQAQAVHTAYQADALYARLDRSNGARLEVKRIWQDPHDAGRITLFLD